MINDFGFIIPQNCQFGVGALKKLPAFLRSAGSSKVMLVSDRMLEKIGVVEKVRKILIEGNITVNPRAVSIKDVEALYEKTI